MLVVLCCMLCIGADKRLDKAKSNESGVRPSGSGSSPSGSGIRISD